MQHNEVRLLVVDRPAGSEFVIEGWVNLPRWGGGGGGGGGGGCHRYGTSSFY